MRVCLVGETDVGKTTLCKQIINQKNFITSPTIGCEFFSTTHKGHKIEIWDTAGQERYKALLPMYLRKAKIIIYVISAIDLENENYSYWIKYIKKNADINHKIIIVITKCDINKKYKQDLVYLKNYIKDPTILFKYNNNISNKLLNTIIYSFNNIKETTNINYTEDNYISLNDNDFRNKKPKCCS